jgi:hypothetical protein
MVGREYRMPDERRNNDRQDEKKAGSVQETWNSIERMQRLFVRLEFEGVGVLAIRHPIYLQDHTMRSQLCR